MTYYGFFLPRAISEIISREVVKLSKHIFSAMSYHHKDNIFADPAAYMRIIILRVSRFFKNLIPSSMAFFNILAWRFFPYRFIPPRHASEWEGKR